MTRARTAVAAIALACLTLAAFHGMASCGFLHYDDDLYVTANPHVLSGVTLGGAAWALTTFHAANWHPLTWLSHMLDVTLFGLDASGHHAMSLALHVANAVLLFGLLARMTGALWRPLLAATLFAVHPLHVQSVAWIAERKDVLSTLLWIATTFAWVRFLESRTAARYVAVVALFAAGLMAKPMLVTLPLTLWLLERWPLARPLSRASFIDKLPLLAMSAASAVVTIVAQRSGAAVESLETWSLKARLAGVVHGYVWYLAKTIRPDAFACFYPHLRVLPFYAIGLEAVFLVSLTIVAVRLRAGAPYLLFGWAWYLVTLLPVIGIVQAGDQAYADRYSYVPLIGIFVALAWGLGSLAARAPWGRAVAATAAAAAVAALVPVTAAQVTYWKDDRALMEHALSVTHDNAIAHNSLAGVLRAEGHMDEAIEHAREAVRIEPAVGVFQYDLASLLRETNRIDEALPAFEAAARLMPRDPETLHALAATHNDLGVALAQDGRLTEALKEFETAIALAPEFRPARDNAERARRALGSAP